MNRHCKPGCIYDPQTILRHTGPELSHLCCTLVTGRWKLAIFRAGDLRLERSYLVTDRTFAAFQDPARNLDFSAGQPV